MSAALAWPAAPLDSAEEVADALFGLYTQHGCTHYDAAVTQTEHALQSAALAEAEGAGDDLVVAALLHDVGHLLVDEHAGQDDFLDDDAHHEGVGAAVLGRWFPATVTGAIALHVPAKRYLVAIDPGYAATLSEASVRSLAVQGGAMTGQEAVRFAQRRYAEAACRLRRWDDGAKVGGRTTPGFAHFRPVVQRLVRLRPT